MFFFKLFLTETNVYISLLFFTLNDRNKDLIIKLNKKVLLKTNLFIIIHVVLTLLSISVSKILT